MSEAPGTEERLADYLPEKTLFTRLLIFHLLSHIINIYWAPDTRQVQF